MAIWKIEKNTSSYEDESERFEEVEADGYIDSEDGEWIDFYSQGGSQAGKVFRVRSTDVKRIEKV